MKFLRQLFILIALMILPGCPAKEPPNKDSGKLHVVTTLFPLYDMARAIGGTYAEVSLLLPPGAEAHTFEPRPGDMLRLNKAALFIYTGRFMEPWAESLVKGLDNRGLHAIDASRGIPLLKEADEHGTGAPGSDSHHHEEGTDPHIWLDLANARVMTETILEGFLARDPGHAESYRRNAAAYQQKLAELDQEFRTRLTSCGSRNVVHGGHFAFGYLARRYNLAYVSAFPASGDAEPNARKMAELVGAIRKSGARYLFVEELASPRLADTLARETGVGVLTLSSAHNVSKEALARGITFPDIMTHNLDNLRKGLACQ